MSVYHYIVCDEHRQIAPVCGQSGKLMVKAAEFLGPFILEHQACALRVISEHAQEFDEYTDVSDTEDPDVWGPSAPNPTGFVGVVDDTFLGAHMKESK